MAEYKIVKWCGLCKKRFVVERTEARAYYCKDCYKRIQKSNKEEADRKDKEEAELREKEEKLELKRQLKKKVKKKKKKA